MPAQNTPGQKTDCSSTAGADDGDERTLTLDDPDLLMGMGAGQDRIINLGMLYKPRRGEDIQSVAERLRTTVRSLLLLNPDLETQGIGEWSHSWRARPAQGQIIQLTGQLQVQGRRWQRGQSFAWCRARLMIDKLVVRWISASRRNDVDFHVDANGLDESF